jgi:anthranilate phosphoribosyltransferase
MDEASIYDVTDVLEIKNNNITSFTIDPIKYELVGDDLENIKTNTERSSLDIIYSVINNLDSDARKISVLNAALLVMLYKEIDLKDAIEQCKDSLDSYLVRDKFNQYIDFTNQVSKNAK